MNIRDFVALAVYFVSIWVKRFMLVHVCAFLMVPVKVYRVCVWFVQNVKEYFIFAALL